MKESDDGFKELPQYTVRPASRNNLFGRLRRRKHSTWSRPAITKAPVLKLPDFKNSFELFTDASSIKVVAVLNQEQKPVVFASRTLSAVDRNYTVTERECLAEEARRNTKAKHEKWEKYHSRRRRDVQIKVNDWVLIATHPLNSATKRVVAKFKPKFEGPYRVLDVKNNNVVVWKAGKRLTVNVDQCIRSHESGSSEPDRKLQKNSNYRVLKRALSSNDFNVLQKCSRKRPEQDKVAVSTNRYNLRSRGGREVERESRLTMERKTQQGGPVRSRKSRGKNGNPYIEERTRAGNRNARRRGGPQREKQETKGASTGRSLSLEVLVGNANYKS
ncbi:uncharacterized protein TNCV_1765721 [Trichonephila clavipes]|nr:uncharacterized protein TNCV_1765721 [Trichonephila clavipes]